MDVEVLHPRPKLETRLKKLGSLEDAAYFLRQKGVKVSASYLSMLSSGKKDPSLKLARRIAEVLEMRFSDVVGE